MPRRKTKKKQDFVFKNTEFWIGLTVFTLTTITAFTLAYKSLSKCYTDKPRVTPKVKSENRSAPPAMNVPKQVKILDNDSYWNISTRACGGDGRHYLSIQSQNGSKDLVPGETAIADCSK